MRRLAHDPGWLRQRLRVEWPEATPDGSGGETIAWQELATLWARIEPAGAEELAIGAHLATMVSHRVTLRWRDDISGGMRLVHRGRIFRVLAAHDPDETRRYLTISALEETA